MRRGPGRSSIAQGLVVPVREAALDYSILAPQRPILPEIPASIARSGVTDGRWLQQARRRANILAHARQLLAEEGYEHVAIRHLAARSGVTPPTIYNLIGGRDEVLRRAVHEAHCAKLAFACVRAEAEDINSLLAYADTLWMSLSREPAYSRQLIRVLLHPSLDAELPRLIRGATKAAILSWLTALEDAGRMRRKTNLSVVAELANRQFVTAVGAWAEGRAGLLELRREMAMGIGLMMLGMVDEIEAARIEAWLSQPGLEFGV